MTTNAASHAALPHPAPSSDLAVACRDGHGRDGGGNDNNEAGFASEHDGGEDRAPGEALRTDEPYMVPEAWRRVLTACNEDIAVGITLDGVLPGEAGLSCVDFEHPIPDLDAQEAAPSASSGTVSLADGGDEEAATPSEGLKGKGPIRVPGRLT